MRSFPTTTAIPCASASASQSEFARLYPFSAPDGRGSLIYFAAQSLLPGRDLRRFHNRVPLLGKMRDVS
jgi:hypothetical protein